MSKYSGGEQRVLMFSWDITSEFTTTVLVSDEPEPVYLICKHGESFNRGDLIAARCVKASNSSHYSVWERLGDK